MWNKVVVYIFPFCKIDNMQQLKSFTCKANIEGLCFCIIQVRCQEKINENAISNKNLLLSIVGTTKWRRKAHTYDSFR